MDKSEVNISKCICKAFQNEGYDAVENSNPFVFTPLDLEIDGIMDNLSENNSNLKTARLKIVLTHKKIFPDSIFEYVYGWGDTYEKAVINAYERWVDSDFPVFHDYIADHKMSENSTSEFKVASHSGETGENISWLGIVGPLLHFKGCLLYTSPSPRDATLSRMPSSA